MGSTIAEKVLARAAGRPAARAGDELMARPDFVLAYELRGYTDAYVRDMRKLGVSKLPDARRFAIFIDHRVPAKAPQDEEQHVQTRRWCAENEVALFDRRGIGHQVAAEAGYAVPGGFVVHFDGHISQLGTFGTLAMGIRANLLEAWVREHVSLRVPGTVRVLLQGALRPGVSARDVSHHLLQLLGPSGARGQVLEIDGPGVEQLSIEGLQTITCLAMFTGAVTAVVSPTPRLLRAARATARLPLDPVRSDADAVFAATHTVDLGDVEPMVVAPPSPANVRPLAAHAGMQVDAGYLGSCASGRLEDLQVAARILKGRRIAPGFTLHVVPTSQAIFAAASADGTIATLVEAGAFVSGPSCDFCSGNIATVARGQRLLSTGTLNTPGRNGDPDAEIWLCSAATLAASAATGELTDPRKLLEH
jgi:3-isopropylmalate/(R)-2-methylmalate dehydratase large subunit